MEWICRQIVHLLMFSAAVCESSFLKMPVKMSSAICQQLTKWVFRVRILKIVKK
jgi:hypothetical protein